MKKISFIPTLILVSTLTLCASLSAEEIPQANESTLDSPGIQSRVEKWRRLREENPEAFNRAIAERKAAVKEKLQSLKQENPQKFEAVQNHILQNRRERLERLKQENPSQFRQMMENRMQKVRELKTRNPEKFQAMMERHPRFAERFKARESRGQGNQMGPGGNPGAPQPMREQRIQENREKFARFQQENPEKAKQFLENHPRFKEKIEASQNGMPNQTGDLGSRQKNFQEPGNRGQDQFVTRNSGEAKEPFQNQEAGAKGLPPENGAAMGPRGFRGQEGRNNLAGINPQDGMNQGPKPGGFNSPAGREFFNRPPNQGNFGEKGFRQNEFKPAGSGPGQAGVYGTGPRPEGNRQPGQGPSGNQGFKERGDRGVNRRERP